MKFCIINIGTLEVEYAYESDQKKTFGGPWSTEKYKHLPVDDLYDLEAIKGEIVDDEIVVSEDIDKKEDLETEKKLISLYEKALSALIWDKVKKDNTLTQKELDKIAEKEK